MVSCCQCSHCYEKCQGQIGIKQVLGMGYRSEGQGHISWYYPAVWVLIALKNVKVILVSNGYNMFRNMLVLKVKVTSSSILCQCSLCCEKVKVIHVHVLVSNLYICIFWMLVLNVKVTLSKGPTVNLNSDMITNGMLVLKVNVTSHGILQSVFSLL